MSNLPRDIKIMSESRREAATPKLKVVSHEQIQQQIGGVRSSAEIVFDLLKDNYQMADSERFLKTGSVTISTTSFVDIVTFTIPTGSKGVLKFFGQGATSVAAFEDPIHWQLTLNGNPVADLGDFTSQLGSISTPKPVTIRLNSNDAIALRAKKTTDNYLVVGLLEGWYWGV